MAKKKVGIDIGHGENTYESGGGKGVKKNNKVHEEHHFNSAVAQIVDKRLKALGFDTFMAQKPYKNDVALATRTKQYNAQDCDIVISIHANAGTSSAKGACAFYWHTSSKSKKLAELFMKHWKTTVKGVGEFGTGEIASKPNFWTNFHMVRETKMEAILVECGFMTNSNDFEYIFGSKKNTYIPQVAEAIVKAVCEYFGVKYSEDKEDIPVPQAPSKDGKHKIAKGDTFYSISNKYSVSVQDLQKANPKVKATALKVGTYLTIPKKTTPSNTKHKIVKGDTFWSLADEYGTTVDRIKKANVGVDPAELKIGQTINIPVAGKPAPKGDQKTDSIVTYLQSVGQDSSFANREKLAKKHGVSNYSGTADQNLLLLKKIRGH